MSSSVETENAIGKTDKEEIITHYPEQEYDVDSEYYTDEEGYFRTRDYRSIAERVAGAEEFIIEKMCSNSVRALYASVEHIQSWIHFEGLPVDEAVVNIKRRIKAGIIVKPPRPPSKILTYEEIKRLERRSNQNHVI